MDHYDGPATLVAPDGTETEAEVSLSTSKSGNLKVWSGTATVEDFDITAHSDQTLQLPDGKQGRVIVQSGNVLDRPIVLQLSGSGVPPYA